MKNFRFLSIIMAMVLAFSCINCFASTDAATEVIYKGDIDLDGNINASDALQALKHAAKITVVNTLIADVDEDTSVNASDALLILKYAAKLITEFPGGNTIGGSTPAPTETTSPVPSETTSPAPSETTSPTPSETTSPTPSETTSPAPSETTSPAPSETTSPAPSETTSPTPSETTSPTPSETTSPTPSETTSPTPSETTSPAPSETTSPAPTEVATPEPTPTVTPEPTATPTPIEQVKTHIQENGYKEEDGSFTIGYSYEDGTVISSINYNAASDTMVFNLLYYDVTDEDETMSVEISMDYDSTFDDADLTVTYSNADYTQIYQAKTPINPETITSESEYAFVETHSENCSSAEKEAILSLADMYMETALYLWNDILQTDPGISLSDLGFTNYSAQ